MKAVLQTERNTIHQHWWCWSFRDSSWTFMVHVPSTVRSTRV